MPPPTHIFSSPPSPPPSPPTIETNTDNTNDKPPPHDKQVLDRIELRPTSIEREVFPHVAADKALFAFTLQGYWMDVGQPKDYLSGLRLHLDALRIHKPAELAVGAHFRGNVLVDPSAKIGSGCLIGPDVCLGPGCVIGDGVRLSNAVIMKGVVVGDHAKVESCIVGWDSKLGAWARLEGFCVLGEDVAVKTELYLNGAVVLPHKEIKESVGQPTIIL